MQAYLPQELDLDEIESRIRMEMYIKLRKIWVLTLSMDSCFEVVSFRRVSSCDIDLCANSQADDKQPLLTTIKVSIIPSMFASFKRSAPTQMYQSMQYAFQHCVQYTKRQYMPTWI
jgi:hypothetical protein